MLNFVKIVTKYNKGICQITPKFIGKKSSDLMIRGGDFYAVWDEENNTWSTDEETVFRIVDDELKQTADSIKDASKVIDYMWDCDSGSIDRWHKYCQKQMRDNYHILDQTIKFENSEVKKKDYSSKKVSYSLEKGVHDSYDKLMSVLYSDEERHKLEWAIGSIVSGESVNVQKFLVLYGSAGTGKSTILNIIQQLFDGYWVSFDAESIGNGRSSFSLEPFKTFPLVGIQHDGDLSRIENNTKLNSLVSHETQPMNAKFEKLYSAKVNAFLFMGTNKPVKITDAKSGILRRLIDVSPTGDKIKSSDYKKLIKQIKFELGAIAYHCKEVYEENPAFYDHYIPTGMMGASNDFYNFVVDSSSIFESQNGTTLKAAWELYKAYADDANLSYPLTKTKFKEELKNYFSIFSELKRLDDGTRVRNYYELFELDKFVNGATKSKDITVNPNWIKLENQKSLLDAELADCKAQYVTKDETPLCSWDKCKTKLKEINTNKLHYVKPEEHHIVIDFDMRVNGEKNLEKNLEMANGWPKTYVEVSKGGQGLHLHYIYKGDPDELSAVYDDQIEIKKFTGKMSLRRKLSLCNNLQISALKKGDLPLRGDKKMVNKDVIYNEKGLITLIKRNLNKEYHPGTKPSIDFINHILDEAYESGIEYDVSDYKEAILNFAAHSTNHSQYCMKIVANMKFKSENYISDGIQNPEKLNIVFYDVEVMPNLFVICYKLLGSESVISMINPKPTEVESLITKYDLVGFNNRKYDNHIIYARAMRGYTNSQLYLLSQDIIMNKTGFFGQAYNLSYTDIYDFSSKKQSLKKWEIELGISHKELGLPWDQPVAEELWETVAEYCKNDVLATEAVWNARQADFTAREILVSIVKKMHDINVSLNDTTNTLSQKIIFGNIKHPQKGFNYRDLSKPVSWRKHGEYFRKFGNNYRFRVFNEKGLPEYRDYIPGEELPDGWSILPFFPEYKFDKFAKGKAKSLYLGEEIGEGGKVYAEPGMYGDVWDGDVSSMHPHSIISEVLFGKEFTQRFEELVKARVAIKHHDFKEAEEMLNGALKPYLNESQADDLAYALKIVINSVYGLTSAAFENPFKDQNNIDNIVAKRGALFMTMLKREVERRSYKVCHIKTDSIKIPDATDYIRDFVIRFGKEFGYTFETEADFNKYCLINDAVYVAKTKKGEWITVGKEFQVPYVYKKLFSNEEITFSDMCETFAVSKGALYLDMNENLPNVTELEKELKKQMKKNPDADFKEIKDKINKGHNYIFIGRVGQFTPIKSGNNAGVLFRINDGKAYAAAGSTGYRWLESAVVMKDEKLLKQIDKRFYEKLVNEAIDDISKFGDFEWFVSDDPYVAPLDIHSDELPF